VLNSSDRLMIQGLDSELGVIKYSVAYNLASVALLVTATLAIWLPSRMFSNFKLWSSKEKQLQFLMVYTPLIILLSIFSFTLLKIDQEYYGFFKYYGSEIDIVFILSAFGCFFTGLVAYSSNMLVYMKKTKHVLFLDFFSALINLVLNYFLISEHGIIGAAVATVVSFSFQFGLSFFLALKFSREEQLLTTVSESKLID
jgi:O-antigen/teichoic acid export membrane protein